MNKTEITVDLDKEFVIRAASSRSQHYQKKYEERFDSLIKLAMRPKKFLWIFPIKPKTRDEAVKEVYDNQKDLLVSDSDMELYERIVCDDQKLIRAAELTTTYVTMSFKEAYALSTWI